MDQERSEQYLRLALEEARCAMLMVDGEGLIVFANHAAESLTGYALNELLGLPTRGGRDVHVYDCRVRGTRCTRHVQ